MQFVGRTLFILLIGIPATQVVLAQGTNDFCEQYRGNTASDTFCQEVACKKFCESTTMPFYCMDTNYVRTAKCTYHGDIAPSYCTSKVQGVSPKYDDWCQTVACSYATYKCLMSNRHGCYSKIGYWVSLSHGEFCKEKQCSNVENPCGSPSEKPPASTEKPPANTERPPANTERPTTTTTRPPTTTTTTRRPTTTTTRPPAPTEKPSQEGCYARGDWSTKPCMLCPNSKSTDAQCPSFAWTNCFPTLQECKKKSGG